MRDIQTAASISLIALIEVYTPLPLHRSLRDAHASGFLGQLDTIIQAVKRLNPSYVVYHLADVRLDGPTYSPVFGSRRTGLGFVHFSDHKTGLVAPSRQPNSQARRMFVVDEIPW